MSWIDRIHVLFRLLQVFVVFVPTHLLSRSLMMLDPKVLVRAHRTVGKSSPRQRRRLALHSTHEAAAKIAGIGAVLEGLLSDPAYCEQYNLNLLFGPYHFPASGHPLSRVLFDSASPNPSQAELHTLLQPIADRSSVRIIVGTRTVGKADVHVLLVQPHGIKCDLVDGFKAAVHQRFQVDLARFERYPAIEYRPDPTLQRHLEFSAALELDPQASYPAWPKPEMAIRGTQGQLLPGGVRFVAKRALFPEIRSLDAFQDFAGHNHYLVELQFYYFAAQIAWQAAKVLAVEYFRVSAEDTFFFCHDWVGVPAFWAMMLDDFRPAASIYVAHETRLCRLLVEGNIFDKQQLLQEVCHPDGKDVAFYPFLRELESRKATLDQAFPAVASVTPGGAFKDIHYHVLNCEMRYFDLIVPVGENVKRESELLLRGSQQRPPVVVCPNGISSESVELSEVVEAEARLKQLSEYHLGYRPDVIFSSVSRCELSKAPWRTVDFYRRYAESSENSRSVLFWLSRPRPLPTPAQIQTWQQQDPPWPLSHQSASLDGDLRPEEESLWDLIRQLNETFQGRHHIVYVNQFGWETSPQGEGNPLGSLELLGTTFRDLRVGTSVELGMAIMEPFGISPVDPLPSGAICIVSDASGCAAHLAHVAADAGDCFIIARFASAASIVPSRVDLRELRRAEQATYDQVLLELKAKLQVPREKRIAAAQSVLPRLSWSASTRTLLAAIDSLSCPPIH